MQLDHSARRNMMVVIKPWTRPSPWITMPQTAEETSMSRPAPEFMFDFGSPNAFLSHEAIPAIEKRIGVQFFYVPILLGGIFKATNNRSPAETLAGVKNKPAFQQLETERFVKRFGVK